MPLQSFLLCLGAAGLLSSCATAPLPMPAALQTVPHVDLSRYMGDWRVIANIPYFAEKNCVDSLESYALREDGTIANRFQYRKKSFAAPLKELHFTAEVVDKATNAEWRVRFLPFVKVAYLILDLDPDYQWTVVGHPSRKYGWIMARGKSLPDETYAAILRRLAAQGYDPGKFVKVPQTPPADAPQPST